MTYTANTLVTKVFYPTREELPGQVIDFIITHPQTSWFHIHPICGCSPAKTAFFPLLIVVFRESEVEGVIVALHLSKHFHVWPAGNPSRIQANGSPLIRSSTESREEILSLLLNQALLLAKEKTAVLEFRNHYDTSTDLKTWLHLGFTFSEHLNLIKEIISPEQLWIELGANRRRQIKKAISQGITVRPAENEQQVESFYTILSGLYQKKVKKAYPPLTFFLDFFNHCQCHQQGVILLAFANDVVIGGIVCPVHEQKVMFEWYVCGLDKEHPHAHPSIMVTWNALLYACEQGIQKFDFMGLGKPGIPYGVRDFKLRFGGTIVNYGRYAKDFSNLNLLTSDT